MSVTVEQPKSYLQAVMQGLEVPDVQEAPEVLNVPQEEPKVPPEVTVVKSSWDLLLESKSSNEKEKKIKKIKKTWGWAWKRQQQQKKISLLTVGSERLAISVLLARSACLPKRIVREFLLVATAVSLANLGMYFFKLLIKNLKNFLIFDIFLRKCFMLDLLGQ